MTTDSGYRDINTALSKHGRAGPSNVSLVNVSYSDLIVEETICEINLHFPLLVSVGNF